MKEQELLIKKYNVENMSEAEKDKLRSSTLHKNEKLQVIYSGSACNFPVGVPIDVIGLYARNSGLPYPLPKWEVSNYYVIDLDGDMLMIGSDGLGKLHPGFEWVKNNSCLI